MATENEKKIYRLYAMPLTAENIGKAANERFSRATPTPEPGYVLIYTAADAPEGALEITQEERGNLLTPADVQWMMDNRAAIIFEALRKNETEVLKTMGKQVEALERELRQKKNEITGKGE